MKCLAVAMTPSWPMPRGCLPCSPLTASYPYARVIRGSSEKPSYVRPHRSSWGTETLGANAQSWPVARICRAVAAPMSRTRHGSWAAPSPMLCGKTVVP